MTMASASVKLSRAAASVGIDATSPASILEIAGLRLKDALDDGADGSNPRVAALSLLISAARRETSDGQTTTATTQTADFIATAVHADALNYVSALGLSNASNLSDSDAFEQMPSSCNSGDRPQSERSTPPRRTQKKLRLLPKFANIATEQVLNLVRTDEILAAKAASQVAASMPSVPTRRKTPARDSRGVQKPKKPIESSDVLTSVQPKDLKRESDFNSVKTGPNVQTAVLSQSLANQQANRSVAVSSSRPGFPAESTLGLYQPPPAAIYQTSGALNGAGFCTQSAPAASPGSINNAPKIQGVEEQQPVVSSRQSSASDKILYHPTPSPSYKTSPTEHHQQPSVVAHSAKPAHACWPSSLVPQGLTVLVPDEAAADALDAMDGFVVPLERTFGYPSQHQAGSAKLKAVLAERERILYTLAQLRQAELASLPEHVSDSLRRKAVIEGKQIKLIELQRSIRGRIASEHRKLFNMSPAESLFVPSNDLARFYRRRDPPVYAYTDGYPRASPIDGSSGPPPRSAQTIATESARMAHYDHSRMQKQRVERHRSYLVRLMTHQQGFASSHSVAHQSRVRIHKGLDRHWLDKKRQEEKRKKMEQSERLRLLRSNDEEAYLKLLKSTKNERLLQLVSQTDNYLVQIGAKVEKTRDGAALYGTAGANVFEQEAPSKNEDTVETLRRRRDMYYYVAHTISEDVRQPSIMVNGTLKPYQIDGLRWMVSLYNNNLNGILADEMGLGKTIQTIALITYLMETKRNVGPYLIIVPLSTIGNWVRELNLWAPSVVKVVYRGGPTIRRQIYETEMMGFNFNVLLTTYEFVVRDQAILGKIHWKYIIIDEGHRMKNANCKLAMTLGVRYRSRNRLLLTGTPLQNNLTELWALLNFLLPNIFSSSDTFEQWFKKPFEQTTLGDAAELEEEETYLIINRLHQVLRPFLLRRLKTDVESQLPEKVESVVRCDMSVWQRVLYRQMQNRIQLATGEGEGSIRTFNNLLMQLKKICNHPFIFYGPEALDKLPQDALVRASGKFQLLSHVLAKLRKCGHRTLIFSQMTTALDYLEDFLVQLDVPYLRLDGSTNAEERQGMLNQFNAPDSPYFCFLLSTRAGGLGLNLQTADTVIIFDSDWNPMMDLQAQDRAHRIGQTQEVRVFRLISSGTVEVKILEQANRKLQVDAQVIQAGQFNNKSTETDRETMLKSILRQRAGETDELGDGCLDLEDINRVLARSEEEFEIYQQVDAERAKQGLDILMTEESELPAWVLEPEVNHKTREEQEREQMMSLGRGRRKHGTIQDVDRLTEREWISVMEGEMTVEEAFARRDRRIQRRERRNARQIKGSADLDAVSLDEDGNDDSFDNRSNATEEYEVITPPVKPPKRKRGRPPKALSATRVQSHSVGQGRRRGRKRASSILTGTSDEVECGAEAVLDAKPNGDVASFSETEGDDDIDRAATGVTHRSATRRRQSKRRKRVVSTRMDSGTNGSDEQNGSRLSNNGAGLQDPADVLDDSKDVDAVKRRKLANGHARETWDKPLLNGGSSETASRRVSARLRLRVRAPNVGSREN